MKTITKRFLKASVAMLLVVIMLFGTTISGFAAVVDNAQTKAGNYTVTGGMVVYYDDTYAQLSSTSGVGALRFMVGHDSFSRGSLGTKIANTNLYRFVISETWNDAAEFAVFGVSDTSGWGDEYSTIEHRSAYAKAHTDTFTLTGNYSGTFVFYTNTDATKTLVPSHKNSATTGANSYNSANNTQKAFVYAEDSNSYSANPDAGTVSISGYQMTDSTTTTQKSANSTLGSTSEASLSLARSSNVTLTATPATGYSFVGWYTSNTSDTAASTEETFTYLQNGADTTSYYARFKKASSNVTVTAGDNGEATPTGTTSVGSEGLEITATPDTANGYVFKTWEIVSGDGTFDDITSSTTKFYPYEDSEIRATFAYKEFKVGFYQQDGTTQIGDDQTVTYGNSAVKPAESDIPTIDGYTFKDWTPIVGPLTDMTVDEVKYVATYEAIEYTATWKAQYSADGGAYVDGTTGGTVSAYWDSACTQPIDGESTTISLDLDNNAFWLKVTPADGYRYFGVATSYDLDSTTLSGTLQSDGSYVIPCGIDVTNSATQKDYYVKFLKTYNVTIDITDGVESITYSYGDIEEAVDTDTTITVDVDTEVTFTKTLDTPKYIEGVWAVGDDTSAGDTYTLEVLEDTTVTYSPTETFEVTVTEETDNGTVKINGTDYTDPVRVASGETVTLTVTPNENYSATVKIGDQVLTSDANGNYSIIVDGDKAITVTYTDVSCKISFADGVESEELVVGGTCTYTASATDEYCNHSITYSSSDDTIATVNATTGVVTALKPGTVTITATCGNTEGPQATANYTVVVLNPNVKVNTVTLNVNETQTASVSAIDNAPACEYQLKYSVNTGAGYSNNYTITEDGAVTGQKPGSALATVSLYCGETLIGSYSFSVKVNTPSISLTHENIKMYPSHTFDGLGVSASVAPVSITWVPSGDNVEVISTTETPSVASVTTDAVTEAVESGVVVKVYYNEYYTYEATVNVDIVLPTLNVGNKTAIDLEYGGDKTTDVFTVTVDDEDIVGKCADCDSPITVDTDNHDVATATITDAGLVTVTSTGVGSTTLTLSYHGVEKTITVNVAEFNDVVTIYYKTNNSEHKDDVRLHMWDDTKGVTILDHQKMTLIGYADEAEDQYVYAYKFPRSIITANTEFAFCESDWGDVYTDIPLAQDCDAKMGYSWIGSNKTTFTPVISNPPAVSISTDNVVVRVEETTTLNAVTSAEVVRWTTGDSTIATVENGTLTGVKIGFTDVTAHAFISHGGTNDTLKSLNMDDEDAYEYIASSATAQVLVKRAADNYDVTLYLSTGCQDIDDNSLDPSSTIVWEGSAKDSTTYATLEDITEYTNTNKYNSATVSTTIKNLDYMVQDFVVYNIETRTYVRLPANKTSVDETAGTVTYSATTDVIRENCYIYPVFFHTNEWMTTNEYDALEFYVDKTTTDFDIWGPFVSCYTYGSNDYEYFGEWPGQLMIPSEDGQRWWTRIEVKKNEDGTLDDSAFKGVLFNNYVYHTVDSSNVTHNTAVHTLYKELGIDSQQNRQTYDYREAKSLYEQNYTSIVYEMKDNFDGYHGNYADDDVYTYKVSDSSDADGGLYNFQYLRRYNDKNILLSINGTPNDDPTETVSTAPEADYYVIAKGDVQYGYGSPAYTGDSTFEGRWCVDWYVFDSEGNYVTKILSDAFYKWNSTDDKTTLLTQALINADKGTTASDFDDTVVKISYEAGNWCPQHSDKANKTTQYSYDGQWYGLTDDDTFRVNTVGVLDDGENELNWTYIDSDTPIYEGDYGQAYVVGTDGKYYGEYDVRLGDGYAQLQAFAKDGYIFMGWYTNENGQKTKLSSGAHIPETSVDGPITYYAVFRELDEEAVVITHSIYSNTLPGETNDNIRHHGGKATVWVGVYDATTGATVYEGDESTSSSIAPFTATDGQKFRVVIKSRPMGADYFFAWYTDSKTVDGTPTYEEMLTEEGDVGKMYSDGWRDTEFIYQYKKDKGNNKVNIYTDCVPVSDKARIEFRYLNRFNQNRTIIKEVTLSNDEIRGWEGNGENPFFIEYEDYYYYFKDDNTHSGKYFSEDDAVTGGKNAGITSPEIGTGNNITDLSPNHDVTQAVHQNITWIADEAKHQKCLVTLQAKQQVRQYTLKYKIEGVTDQNDDGSDFDTITDDYNTLLDIEAPAENGDATFSYWYDIDTKEIISYNRYYAYRLVNNRNIEAVYNATDYDPWTSVIENVTKTREYQNNIDNPNEQTDVVYVDYLLAFHNVDDLLVREQTDLEYGLVMIRDADYTYTDTTLNTAFEYPADHGNETLLRSKVDVLARRGLVGGKFSDSGHNYRAYNYVLTGKDVTNLNRLNYIMTFDIKNTDSENQTFSAYAYIYDKTADKVYISKVRNVEIFTEANRDVDFIG